METASLGPYTIQKPALTPEKLAHVEKVAKEFEALTIAQLLAPVFNAVDAPSIGGGGPGEKAYGAMMQEQYAQAIAERGGFGIADSVKAALIRLQSQN